MNARTLILAVLVAAGAVFAAAAADFKVVDRSAKKAPEWLYTLPQGNILIEVERPTLGEAQAEAELELARRIISAVATNITHSTSQQGVERSGTDGIYSLEEFKSKTTTAAARLPFLKGISMSQARGTYWEQREDKKSKRRYVVFSALYPLSKQQLDDMTREFEETDREKSAELKSLRDNLYDVNSSDEIQDAIGRLEALQAYFFDEVRLADAAALAKSYRELYKGLSMNGTFTKGQNRLIVRVELNGQPFMVTGRPNVTSNCASRIAVNHSPDGFAFEITFSTEDCLANEQNYLDVTLRIKNARLHDRFFFDVEE